MPQAPVRSGLGVTAALVVLLAAACGQGSATPRSARSAPSATPATPAVGADPPPVTLAALAHRLRADVQVTGLHTLSAKQVREIAALEHGSVTYASGTVIIGTAKVHAASVDPATFRRFAAAGTAESTAVWQTLARGDSVASHALAKKLHLTLGGPLHVTGTHPLDLRLGALATTGVPGTDFLVDTATGTKLGLGAPSTVLLSAGKADPATLAAKVRGITGARAAVDLLTAPASNPVAFLTGSRAAKAFGAFSYRYFPDGTIVPDNGWVRANIVGATVPILGRVTCHRLMVPQLRGALTEIAKAGLSGTLHTYNGCYVPRFIEHDPSHAISLHTWGIAIDIDASTNYRGIRGTMDPRVVAIFKRWGFRWGGDWSFTDPMHFEIAALLTRPRS